MLSRILTSDHPRSRGVYPRARPGRAAPSGSSPLARGLRPRAPCPRGPPGIIPARAGFTRRHRGRERQPADHPRSRGVYIPAEAAEAAIEGSSPLARGLPDVRVAGSGGLGIIPARAGFTTCQWRRSSPRRDHPRSRGVYRSAEYAATAKRGSSPLARGLQIQDFSFDATWWIIPARAGFTLARVGHRVPREDHPRSRGVYGCLCGSRTSPRGSSPLARGLRRVAPNRTKYFGIIPARAGFTGR